MEKTFDTLIESYLKNGIGIANNFLNKELSGHLKANLSELFDNNQLVLAGTGQTATINPNNIIRSDRIFWLDRKHNNKHENSFFDLMDQFILHLNTTCYAGIKSCEFHYTLYETGSFYKTHTDRFRENDSRQFSMIMYLNENWEEKDGGELCIHLADGNRSISPNEGKSVFFRSNELEHEVLITSKPRMSITGWLKS